LKKLEEAEGLDGMARGVAYRVSEHFGVLPRDLVMEDVKGLSQDERAKLRVHGMRFGAFTLFLPALLKPAATELRILLWHLEKTKADAVPAGVPVAPANGLTSIAADPAKPDGFYDICGYRLCGGRAVRVDMLERLSDLIRDRVFWKPRLPEEQRPAGSVEGGGFTIVSDMMSLVGCSGEDFEKILVSLGFRSQVRTVPKPAAPAVVADVASVEEMVEAVAEHADVPDAAVAVSDSAPVTDAVDAAPPAAETEQVDVTIWWPKDTGPFRHQNKKAHYNRAARQVPVEGRAPVEGQAPVEGRVPVEGERSNKGRRPFRGPSKDVAVNGDGARKPRFEKRSGGPSKGGRDNGGRSDAGRSERNDWTREERPRKEKPMDPLSPFAALLALKEQMKETKS
jgi:ATP-dependent RNA helicase SUPV3L1/SUV3